MKKTHLVLIFVVNLIFYLPIIFSSLKFIEDDYIIFAYIKENPFSPIITDPLAQFFLFMRPLSYFSLWVDFHLFGDNYIAIKLVSLMLHIFFIIVLYHFLNKINDKFRLQIDPNIILLLSLIFSNHLDSQLWISFICNRTEQLMILFYTLSLFFFIKYCDTNKRAHLFLTALFFLLSVLAKQSGLHIPLVILVFILYEYYVNNKTNLWSKEILVFFTFSFILIVLASVFNFIYYHSQISITESFWKKPFTLIAILIHSIIPLYSNYIHNYFLLNKLFAAILFIFSALILMGVILYLVNKDKKNIHRILFTVAISTVILFPRIFAIASQRINGVVLVWLSIAFIFAIKPVKQKKYIFSFLLIIFLFNSYAFYSRANDIIEGDNFKEKSFAKLVSYLNSTSGKTLILCSDTYDVLPYKYYYYSKRSFGKSEVLFTTPIFYEPILLNFNLPLYKKKFIYVEKHNSQFILSSTDPLLYFLIYENDKNINLINILEKVPSESGRGYKKLVFNISTEYLKNFANIIYFDGLEWKEIK